MNYLLVISLYPAILIIHQVYLKKWESACLCFCCNLFSKSKSKDDDNEEPVPKQMDGDSDMMPEINRQMSVEDQQAEEYRCFEQFLGRKWAKFITKFKAIILVIFGIIFVLAAITGSQMEAQSEDEKWFADAHYMQRSQDMLSIIIIPFHLFLFIHQNEPKMYFMIDSAAEFSASETDNLVQIHITFGIDGVDRDGFSRWNPEEYGVVVWDEEFDMSTIAAQEYLVTICERTRNTSLVYREDLVTCPIEDFAKYLESINDTFPYESGNGKKSFEQTYYEFLESQIGSSTANNALSYVELDGDNYYVCLNLYFSLFF